MLSLFTSFDYCIYFLTPYIYFILYLVMLGSFYFFNFLNLMYLNLFGFLKNFYVSLGFSGFEVKGSFYLFISIFFMLFLINFSSVMSFNFPITSHASFVLCLSFVVWSGLFAFNFIKNFSGFLSHLVPSGTPLYLVFFMTMVELISVFIRPMTLTVRLLANVLSGHLLMILLSNLVFILPYFLVFYVFLNMVEMFVSLIQAYIFSTLLVLYASDSL
ncbi:ATP synthase F0 subunit 6 (mitochondrion) [Fragariocoptes setiger]|uniref:ATP synthase subunit a n=1 Tax=Fragariocoptes setiger TaxID=1670756 RepID=A0ABQ7SDB8_9ACAR|nr:ATP synthase F0 subunit 6 [Fragariocoptes setiger]